MTRAALVGCGDVSIIHFEAFDAIDDIELVGVCGTHRYPSGSHRTYRRARLPERG